MSAFAVNPFTVLSILEVGSGILALFIAYILQVVSTRKIHPHYWGGFYLLGCVITLSHVGILLPDTPHQLWFKFWVVIAMITLEVYGAWWVWVHSELPGPEEIDVSDARLRATSIVDKLRDRYDRNGGR